MRMMPKRMEKRIGKQLTVALENGSADFCEVCGRMQCRCKKK